MATLLHEKWIEPVCNDIDKTLSTTLSNLAKEINALKVKYANSFGKITTELKKEASVLSELIEELNGSEYDISALKEFQSIIKR